VSLNERVRSRLRVFLLLLFTPAAAAAVVVLPALLLQLLLLLLDSTARLASVAAALLCVLALSLAAAVEFAIGLGGVALKLLLRCSSVMSVCLCVMYASSVHSPSSDSVASQGTRTCLYEDT
jgi:hypothetical protein